MHMDRAKAIAGEITCLVIALVFWGLYKLFEAPFLVIPAMIFMIASVVFSCFNRCPCCDRWLGRHHLWIEYCPYCGAYL